MSTIASHQFALTRIAARPPTATGVVKRTAANARDA